MKSAKKSTKGKPGRKPKAMKRVTKIARGKRAKLAVFRGKKENTSGGLKQSDLLKNKNGKIVSKKSSLRAKKNKFMQAVSAARKELKIKGFQIVGGKTKAGIELLERARKIHKSMK